MWREIFILKMYSAREGADKVPCTWEHLTRPIAIAVGDELGARHAFNKNIIFWRLEYRIVNRFRH